MSSTISPLRRAVTLAVAAGLVTAVPLALASSAQAAPRGTAVTAEDGQGDHAVFVLTDDPTGNGVIAFARQADGTLVRGATYATGGLGARLAGAVVDPLASQSALAYDREHGLVLAVNAGSDSVTVFAVHGSSLTRLQVVPSGGTLPVSVAVRGDVAYVLDAGNDGAISGFRVTDHGLVRIPGSTRSLGLANPALPNFLLSPAQVAISPDGRHVVVTTKKGGTVLVWQIGDNGRPSAAPTVTTIGAVPFALAFDRSGDLLLSNAAGSVSTFGILADGGLTLVSGPVATGGAATCWLESTGRYAYASNTGSGTITGFAVGLDGTLTRLDPTDGITAVTGGAPVDLAAADGVLYVEDGAHGSLLELAIGADGSLAPIGTVTGLTADGGTGIEGLVAI